MSGVHGISNNVALSLPSGLSAADYGQAEEILEEAESGSISTAQAQAELASLLSGQTQSTSTSVSSSNAQGSQQATGTQSETLAAALDLSPEQQSQIASILKSAQQNGSTPQDVLSQIDGILTPSQQQTLANLQNQPPLFSTTA